MLTASGIGSGLDIEALVTSLIAAERAPADARLLREETTLSTDLSAFGTFKGVLGAFQTSLASLNNLANFSKRIGTSNDNASVSITANSSAAAGSYEVGVTQLASSQSLASGSYTAPTDVVGTGTLTFRFGTTSYTARAPDPNLTDSNYYVGTTGSSPPPDTIPTYNGDNSNYYVGTPGTPPPPSAPIPTYNGDNSDYYLQGRFASLPVSGAKSYDGFVVNPEMGVANITIDNTNNTLEGIRDAINDANIGVSAAIVNDSTGYRLLLSSESGAQSSMEVVVDDTGDGDDVDILGLSALSFHAGASHLDQGVAAQDAIFSVNGLTINSSNNNPTGVISGIDISLKAITTGLPATITVTKDTESVKNSISAFLSGYNNFISTMNALTAYNPDTGFAGDLQGDVTARNVTEQVRRVLTNAVTGFTGPFSSLSEIGITTDAAGNLVMDDADFNAALDANFDDIAGLFAALAVATDSQVEFVSASDATQVGSYDVNITQLATQAQLLAAMANFPLDIDADNDEITLRVDGVSTASIFLTQGTYATGADLAAELQARINGDSALVTSNVSVAVAFNVDHFEITSNRFGSASSVTVTGIDTNTAAELGFSLASGTAGQDVAGTIGGIVGLGSGKTLSGALGSVSEGLSLLITGGALGARGVVDFSRGISHQLNTMITSILKSDGVLDSLTGSIQERIEDIDDERERLDLRMAAVEARYRAQFNALDGLLAQLQNTSAFLTQQLDSLPGSGQLVNK